MRSSLVSWFFLMQFAAVFFKIGVVLVSSQCQTDQRDLLLKFKNSLNLTSSESHKLVKWNQTSDCCNWVGVGCDAEGHVIDLDLSNEWIMDEIENSSCLFNLTHLQSLNLAYNSFSSNFPSGFERFANLSNLNLSCSGFSGQVPIEISRMKTLESLDLSVNVFLGSLLKLEDPNLATLVRNLKELKKLYLDGVNVSAEGKEWCQALSNSLPKLEELSMSNCFLSGPIHSSLSKLQSLSVIHLDSNNFSAPIPEFFAELRNLTLLDLANTNLQGKVPVKIFQVLTLRKLDLSNNQLLEGFIAEFLPGSSLEILLLSDTKLGGTLPKSIGNLGKLSRIELARCKFNGSIPDTVGRLTQLVLLDFSSNGFSGPVPSFSLVRNLTQLNLAHNGLTGSISTTNWSGLSKVESIDLRNNSLNKTLPASLFGIPTLQRMQLLQNQFTGELKGPSGTSLRLDTVDLSENKLAGPFPFFLFQLRSLKILALSSNNFSGPVNLSSFQQLKNLSSLDLSYNSLSINSSGTDPASFPQIRTLRLASCKLENFPDFLKNQSKLNMLDLSDNQISGEIPEWIWSFENLSYLNLSHNFLANLQEPQKGLYSNLFTLDLSDNYLQGPIPNPPPSATYVDYSNNNFSSLIPADIGQFLNFTSFFSLSNNNVQGSIPQSVCSATFLSVLNLSNNSLSGTIPQCLTGMESLVVLNLRRNNLSGDISDTFSSKCGVRTINLNGNQLEGKIPRSLKNCQKLEVLDLGNNQMNDKFPCHLKNISSLRVLVLRSNHFQGGIGCPGDSSTWEKLQIFDLASNNFSGVLPAQCLSTWKAMMVQDVDELHHIRYRVLSFSSLYYQDAITVTMKGMEMQLTKILTVFTSIDFSHNKLEGMIPDVLGNFQALYVLNLSHNALSGSIPSSMGNLSQLESMDLSSNNLTGEIPPKLANLNFLAVLNLSYNHLVGRIPTSSQFQTFSNDSYQGNNGLCGIPLTKTCGSSSSTPDSTEHSGLFGNSKLDWPYILIGLGFGVGAAVVVAPLMFCKRASEWIDYIVDRILLTLLPLVGLSYDPYWRIENEEEENPEEEDNTETSVSDDEDAEAKTEEIRGRYCIICSKIDIFKKRVIHDPKCTCYDSPPPSFSSVSPSSVSS